MGTRAPASRAVGCGEQPAADGPDSGLSRWREFGGSTVGGAAWGRGGFDLGSPGSSAEPLSPHMSPRLRPPGRGHLEVAGAPPPQTHERPVTGWE